MGSQIKLKGQGGRVQTSTRDGESHEPFVPGKRFPSGVYLKDVLAQTESLKGERGVRNVPRLCFQSCAGRKKSGEGKEYGP